MRKQQEESLVIKDIRRNFVHVAANVGDNTTNALIIQNLERSSGHVFSREKSASVDALKHLAL